MFRLRQYLPLIVLLALVMSACAPAATSTTAPQPTAPPAKPTEAPPQPTAVKAAERKVATFIWTQEFDNLNPHYTNMWFSTITQQIWGCHAWNFDDQNHPVQGLS